MNPIAKLFRFIGYLFDYLFELNDTTTTGRFKDGRKYEISSSGRMRICMEDKQTRIVYAKDIEDFHSRMRKAQPHMYDKNGKFIGGEFTLPN